MIKFLKGNQSRIWESKFSLAVVALSILVNFSMWILFYFKVEPSRYPIPLHYNIYTGIDTIDFWYKILVIPSFGLFLLVVNFFIGLFFLDKERFVSYILFVSGLFIQMILFVSMAVLTWEL
jgi:hypothetical protein